MAPVGAPRYTRPMTNDGWTGLLLSDGKLPSIDHLRGRSTNWLSWKRTISCGISRRPGFGQMVIGQRLKPLLLKPSKQIPIGFWFSLLSFSSWILLCLGFPLGLGPFTSRAHQSFHRDFHPDSARQCNTVKHSAVLRWSEHWSEQRREMWSHLWDQSQLWTRSLCWGGSWNYWPSTFNNQDNVPVIFCDGHRKSSLYPNVML